MTDPKKIGDSERLQVAQKVLHELMHECLSKADSPLEFNAAAVRAMLRFSDAERVSHELQPTTPTMRLSKLNEAQRLHGDLLDLREFRVKFDCQPMGTLTLGMNADVIRPDANWMARAKSAVTELLDREIALREEWLKRLGVEVDQ